jgi:hypothetical protein
MEWNNWDRDEVSYERDIEAWFGWVGWMKTKERQESMGRLFINYLAIVP